MVRHMSVMLYAMVNALIHVRVARCPRREPREVSNVPARLSSAQHLDEARVGKSSHRDSAASSLVVLAHLSLQAHKVSL